MNKIFKYKWISGSVEITENNELVRKLNSRINWTIPVSSITIIADAYFSYLPRRSPRKNGFVVQADNKLYAIRHNLENNEEFINTLKSINPQIVYQQPEGFYVTTDLWRKYLDQSIVFRIIVIIFVIFVLYALYAAVSASIKGGGLTNFLN